MYPELGRTPSTGSPCGLDRRDERPLVRRDSGVLEFVGLSKSPIRNSSDAATG